MRAMLLVLWCGSCAGVPTAADPVPEPVRLIVDGVEKAFRDPQVLSIADAQEAFQVTLVAGRLADDGGSSQIGLALGHLRLVACAWSNDGDDAWFVFPATPAQARSFAHALGVPAREREPWRGELAGALEPVGAAAAGAATWPLRFTMTNAGPVALWFLDGGRGRNRLGRDNRFTFTIERDGERLATQQVEDFGGLGAWRRLAPREAFTFAIDLAHWCAPERPGRYTIRASYEAELMAGEFEPGKAMAVGWYTHLRRVRNVPTELVLEVR
jgi:hypothetical protein